MSLSFKFWGVRGSLPSAPTPQDWAFHIEGIMRGFFSAGYKEPSQITKFFSSLEIPQLGGYGAATTCVEVNSPKNQIIIDGGSGLRGLSDRILTGTSGHGRGPFHILMTHFHWDHLIGIPFFTPHFMPGTQIHYYAVQPELESIIRSIFSKPTFPVPFESLMSKIHFHKLEPRKTFNIGDIEITPYKLDHPDPCWGYRISCNNKIYAHCVDTEGTRVTREELGEDLPLYENADLMFFDAQYTFPELAEKANWGHSASQVGLEIALRENVKHLLFTHHDPGATIQQISEIKRQTGEYYKWRENSARENHENFNPVIWDFVHEGYEFKLK